MVAFAIYLYIAHFLSFFSGRGRRRSTLAQEKTNKIWDAVKEKAAEEDEKKKKKKAEDFEIVSAPVDEEKES